MIALDGNAIAGDLIEVLGADFAAARRRSLPPGRNFLRTTGAGVDRTLVDPREEAVCSAA